MGQKRQQLVFRSLACCRILWVKGGPQDVLLPLASWIVAVALEELCGTWGKFFPPGSELRWAGMGEGNV